MKYFYVGPSFDVSIAKSNALSELMPVTGNNTGNLLIGDAIRKHLNVGQPAWGFKTIDTDRVTKEYDAVIIGAANFLHEKFDFGYHADFIEKIKLPTVIIGVGAQAPNYGTKLKIPEGTKRFMEIISERSHSLGVRGYYTAYVLNDMGIKNVRAVGCPSMYWNCEPELSVQIKKFEDYKKVIVNGSSNVIEHSVDRKAAQKVEKFLASLSFRYDYPYILQNELDEMKILYGEPGADEKNLLDQLKERYALHKRYGMQAVSDKVFKNFIKNNMKVFFNVEEWMNFVRTHDLVVGTRFHGTLIGLLVGIPSILVSHDSRTREMAELLHIPVIDVRSAQNLSLRELYSKADFTAFEITYQYMYKNYIHFLDENNLKHFLLPNKN